MVKSKSRGCKMITSKCHWYDNKNTAEQREIRLTYLAKFRQKKSEHYQSKSLQ